MPDESPVPMLTPAMEFLLSATGTVVGSGPGSREGAVRRPRWPRRGVGALLGSAHRAPTLTRTAELCPLRTPDGSGASAGDDVRRNAGEGRGRSLPPRRV